MLRRVYALGHSCTRLRLVTSKCWDEGPRWGEAGSKARCCVGTVRFPFEALEGDVGSTSLVTRALPYTDVTHRACTEHALL